MLNGVNSRMVAKITGRTIKEEANKVTLTFDVVTWIRVRRLQWVSHILLMENNDTEPRLIYKAVSYTRMWIDVPETCSWTFHGTATGKTW